MRSTLPIDRTVLDDALPGSIRAPLGESPWHYLSNVRVAASCGA